MILPTKVCCFCATGTNGMILNIELRLTTQPGHLRGVTGTKAIKLNNYVASLPLNKDTGI